MKPFVPGAILRALVNFCMFFVFIPIDYKCWLCAHVPFLKALKKEKQLNEKLCLV